MKDACFIPPTGRPLIFGEVLFDTFDDGREVLGGAPFNVARHLQGFGMDCLFVSRIGDDDRGCAVRDAMADWQMDAAGLQVDPDRATGVVTVTSSGGHNDFDIAADQAFDFIDSAPLTMLLAQESFSLVYYGSLIARSARSREALSALRASSLPLFVDINLRAPWWRREDVLELLEGVRWAKLNDEELRQLGFEGAVDDAALAMREAFGFDLLALTCAAAGALFAGPDGIVSGVAPEISDMVDTVGAGDAFSAVVIAGILHGWPRDLTLERALQFAAEICSVRGAVFPDRSRYRDTLEDWGVA